ncbi:MAG: DUF3301 domain-containing protein [Proteobacteria bacterium]|nr:DUF3301 domain-containing protein [Pseudomonadota bacterium]
MSWDAVALVALVAAAYAWIDSLRARERAVAAGRDACRRYNVQLLDDTVSIARLALARDEDGQLRLRREYRFEFSDTGDNRRQGTIVMLGGMIADLILEPYALQ